MPAKVENKIFGAILIDAKYTETESCKRSMLYSAMHNRILYGALVWARTISIQKFKRQLQQLQSDILLHVASAYRTISGKLIEAGTIPKPLLMFESFYLHEHRQKGTGIIFGHRRKMLH